MWRFTHLQLRCNHVVLCTMVPRCGDTELVAAFTMGVNCVVWLPENVRDTPIMLPVTPRNSPPYKKCITVKHKDINIYILVYIVHLLFTVASHLKIVGIENQKVLLSSWYSVVPNKLSHADNVSCILHKCYCSDCSDCSDCSSQYEYSRALAWVLLRPELLSLSSER